MFRIKFKLLKSISVLFLLGVAGVAYAQTPPQLFLGPDFAVTPDQDVTITIYAQAYGNNPDSLTPTVLYDSGTQSIVLSTAILLKPSTNNIRDHGNTGNENLSDGLYSATVVISLTAEETEEFYLQSDSAYRVTGDTLTVSGGGVDQDPKISVQAVFRNGIGWPVTHIRTDFTNFVRYHAQLSDRPAGHDGDMIHLAQHLRLSGRFTVTATIAGGASATADEIGTATVITVILNDIHQTNRVTVGPNGAPSISVNSYRGAAPLTFANTRFAPAIDAGFNDRRFGPSGRRSEIRDAFTLGEQTVTLYDNHKRLTATITAGTKFRVDDDIIGIIQEAFVEDGGVRLAHPPPILRHAVPISTYSFIFVQNSDTDGDGVPKTDREGNGPEDLRKIIANRLGAFSATGGRNLAVAPLATSLKLGPLAVSARLYGRPLNASVIQSQISVREEMLTTLTTYLSDDSSFSNPQGRGNDGAHFYNVNAWLPHFGSQATVAIPLTASVPASARYAAYIFDKTNSSEPNWRFIDNSDPDGRVLWAASAGSTGSGGISCPAPNADSGDWFAQPELESGAPIRCVLVIVRDGGKYDADETSNAVVKIAGAVFDNPISVFETTQVTVDEAIIATMTIGDNAPPNATFALTDVTFAGTAMADQIVTTDADGNLLTEIDTSDVTELMRMTGQLSSPYGARFASHRVTINLRPAVLTGIVKVYLLEEGGALIYARQLFSNVLPDQVATIIGTTPELAEDFIISARVNARNNALLVGENPGFGGPTGSGSQVITITTQHRSSTDMVIETSEITIEYIARHDTQLMLDKDQTLDADLTEITLRAQAYGKRKTNLSHITSFAPIPPVIHSNRQDVPASITLLHQGNGIYQGVHTLSPSPTAGEIIKYELFDSQQDYIYGRSTTYITIRDEDDTDNSAVRTHLAVQLGTTTVAALTTHDDMGTAETYTISATVIVPADDIPSNATLSVHYSAETYPLVSLFSVTGVSSDSEETQTATLQATLPATAISSTISTVDVGSATISLGQSFTLQTVSLSQSLPEQVFAPGRTVVYDTTSDDGTIETLTLTVATTQNFTFTVSRIADLLSVTAEVRNLSGNITPPIVSVYAVVNGDMVADDDNDGIPNDREITSLAQNEMRSSTAAGTMSVMRVSGAGNRLLLGNLARNFVAFVEQNPPSTATDAINTYQNNINELYRQFLRAPGKLTAAQRTLFSLLADTPPTYSETGIFDFVVSLENASDNVLVAIPLTQPLTANDASYWKYISADIGWVPMTPRNNVYWSRAIDADCPAPILRSNLRRFPASADWWRRTPAVGDQCVMLILRDGSSGDDDDAVNYAITDPGAVVYGRNRVPTSLPGGVPPQTPASSGGGGGGGAMSPWSLCWLLALMLGFMGLRHRRQLNH